jgi:hypothetical protein
MVAVANQDKNLGEVDLSQAEAGGEVCGREDGYEGER